MTFFGWVIEGQNPGYNFPAEIDYPYSFWKIEPMLFEIPQYTFSQ